VLGFHGAEEIPRRDSSQRLTAIVEVPKIMCTQLDFQPEEASVHGVKSYARAYILKDQAKDIRREC
jgi:hypothetical protein